MASRKRGNSTFPGTDERLSTKKEKELNDDPSCPPINRKLKSFAPHREKLPSEPKPIGYFKDSVLSTMYDRTSNIPYFNQVFVQCEKIGEGSFGNVYKVCSKEDGKYYAVKVAKGVSSDLHVRYGEAYRLERLGNHPNVIKYFGAWEENDFVFIQLELYTTSLDKYAKLNHCICEEQLWDILIDMLMALKHLHGKQFVHLDIKPDNIMISNDGLYKLGDFGLLIDLFEYNENKLRYARLSDGDAKYLAREVLEGHYTTAADIFSLGITMLELATDLILPSNGNLWHQMRNGILPDHYTEGIPTALLRIIKSMMVGSYSSRPSVQQLLKVEPIKTKVAERSQTTRINYYQLWCERNVVPYEDPLVNIYVHLSQNENNDQNLQVVINNANLEDTPAVTPPRRVSQVNVYTI